MMKEVMGQQNSCILIFIIYMKVFEYHHTNNEQDNIIVLLHYASIISGTSEQWTLQG